MNEFLPTWKPALQKLEVLAQALVPLQASDVSLSVLVLCDLIAGDLAVDRCETIVPISGCHSDASVFVAGDFTLLGWTEHGMNVASYRTCFDFTKALHLN